MLLASLPMWCQSARLNGPITAYGDSITAGAFVNAGQEYPALLSVYYNVSYTDYALQGDTSCEMTDKVFTHENPTRGGQGVYVAMIGTNDATASGVGAYEAVYQTCHQAALSWLATVRGNKVFAGDQACVNTGTWAVDTTYQSIGLVSSTQGSTLTCTISTLGRPIYIWYRIINSNTGTFTYSVDGGSPVSENAYSTPAITDYNGGTQSVAFIRVPVTAGLHHVVFTVTSSSGSVPILAIGTPSPGGAQVYSGGVPYQEGNADAAQTLDYNNDAKSDVSLLAGDGVPIYFVDVRQYLCTQCATTSPDMANTEHPNAQGHQELATGWEDSINAHYTSAQPYWPSWMQLR